MEILNPNFVHVLKYLALIQLGLFLILFALVLGYRIYQERKYRQKQELKTQISKILRANSLSEQDKKLLTKYLHLSVYIFYQIIRDSSKANQESGVVLIRFFSQFIPDFAQSKHGYIRQLASYLLYAKAKLLCLDAEDHHLLNQLIADSVPLVAMNGIRVMSLVPQPEFMTQFMDLFSAQRRVQYDIFRILLQEADITLTGLVVTELSKIKDLRQRGLCYRLLIDLPKDPQIDMPFLAADIASDDLDLSLAALAFMVYARRKYFEETLVKSLQDPRWQVRARAAKLIGKNCPATLADKVSPLLNDENPWVRYRAAEALVNLGKLGIELLQANQFPEAIELAKYQLLGKHS